MTYKNNREKRHEQPEIAKESLSEIISDLDIRRAHPKRIAIEVFNFTNTHDKSQLEALQATSIFARHIKAKLWDISLDLQAEEMEIKYGKVMSQKKEDELIRICKIMPILLSYYENVQKYASVNDNALVAWIQLESALSLKTHFGLNESYVFELGGLETEEIEQKKAMQNGLIKSYAERIGRLRSDESEIAHRWIDRFDRRLQRELILPFMLKKKIIESVDNYSEYEVFPLNLRLREALLEIEENK